MAVPEGEQLLAAERTLEAMGKEIRMAECIALTQPVELGWLGGTFKRCEDASSQGALQSQQQQHFNGCEPNALWRCNHCKRLVLAWRAAEHKQQCVLLPVGGRERHPVTKPPPMAAAVSGERASSGREAPQRKSKVPGGGSGSKASSKGDETARLTKLYRVTYPDLKPGESMTYDLLAGFSEFFNFKQHKLRTQHTPRRKRPCLDTSWLWSPSKPSPTTSKSKSQASKQTGKLLKGPSKQSSAKTTGAGSTSSRPMRVKALTELLPLPPQTPKHEPALAAAPPTSVHIHQQQAQSGQPGAPGHCLSNLEAQRQLQMAKLARMHAQQVSLAQHQQRQVGQMGHQAPALQQESGQDGFGKLSQHQQQQQLQLQHTQLRAQQYRQLQQQPRQPQLLPQYQKQQQQAQLRQYQMAQQQQQQQPSSFLQVPTSIVHTNGCMPSTWSSPMASTNGFMPTPSPTPSGPTSTGFIPNPLPTSYAAASHGFNPTPSPMPIAPTTSSFIPNPSLTSLASTNGFMPTPCAAAPPNQPLLRGTSSSMAMPVAPMMPTSPSGILGSHNPSNQPLLRGTSNNTALPVAPMMPTNRSSMALPPFALMAPTHSSKVSGSLPALVPMNSAGVLQRQATLMVPSNSAPSSSGIVYTPTQLQALQQQQQSNSTMLQPQQHANSTMHQSQQQQQQQQQQQAYARLQQWQLQQMQFRQQQHQQQLSQQEEQHNSLGVPHSRPPGPDKYLGSLNQLVNH